MNTDSHRGTVAALTDLPSLPEERIDAMEDSLFAEIAQERAHGRTRRRRGWFAAGAAAAVIVVAAIIAPSVGALVGGTATGGSAVAPELVPAQGGPQWDAATESGGTSTSDAMDLGGQELRSSAESAGRDIITTASAEVQVEDISAAAEQIADAAGSRDGYVESMSIGRSGQVVPVDPRTGIVYDSTMPFPPTADGAWITVRVPADGLESLTDELSDLGEVTSSTVNRQDVTEITLDLRARVDAAQASVDRLTELMAQAGSLADLIAAESALAERQATLESYQQQLKYYDEQVAMSTLTVTLTEPVETVAANPAGFGDGLAAGWNGLVATLNGIVVALGFLIPWLVVLAVAALVVWAVVTATRRRRNRGRPSKVNPSSGAAPQSGSAAPESDAGPQA